MNAIPFNRSIFDGFRYWPMYIADRPSNTGFRIGGTPPVGIRPKIVHPFTKYFCTIPIEGNKKGELSIFSSFDDSNVDSPLHITENTKKALGEDTEAIQYVFHERAPRGEDSTLASELHGYAVNIGPEATDDPNDERCGVAHKIGGVPFLYPRFKLISDELLGAGYVHFLQWAYPGFGDCDVKGEWAWSDNTLHLYLKDSPAGYEYKALLV